MSLKMYASFKKISKANNQLHKIYDDDVFQRERHRTFRNCSNNMTMHSSEKNASHSAKEREKNMKKLQLNFLIRINILNFIGERELWKLWASMAIHS